MLADVVQLIRDALSEPRMLFLQCIYHGLALSL
jgi:hypothetical protein